MSKRILILTGSPRRGGNSNLMADAFAKGASEAATVLCSLILRINIFKDAELAIIVLARRIKPVFLMMISMNWHL